VHTAPDSPSPLEAVADEPSPSATPNVSPAAYDTRAVFRVSSVAAGAPMFMYPQMAHGVPVDGVEHAPPFAAQSEASLQHLDSSFSSYSTVSQDPGDIQDLPGQMARGVALSGVASQDSWEPQPAAGGTRMRRVRSEDTAATTRMYERSATLANRARAEVADLLDVVNTAHPQWVSFELQACNVHYSIVIWVVIF
jgi:hypothetical protein